MKKQILCTAPILLALVVILTACGKKDNKEVIATINDEQVLVSEFKQQLTPRQVIAIRNPETAEKLLERYIEKRLLLQQAKKLGLDQSDEYKFRSTLLKLSVVLEAWRAHLADSLARAKGDTTGDPYAARAQALQEYEANLEKELDIRFNEKNLQRLFQRITAVREQLAAKKDGLDTKALPQISDDTPIAESRKGVFTFADFMKRAEFTSEQERANLSSVAVLRQFISGLILRDALLDQAFDEGVDLWPQVEQRIRSGREHYLIRKTLAEAMKKNAKPVSGNSANAVVSERERQIRDYIESLKKRARITRDTTLLESLVEQG